MNKSLETMLSELYSIENMTTSMKFAKSSVNKSEIKHLSQALKINEVERSEIVSIAKGEIRTNTFIKMYLTEYTKIRLRYPIDTIVLITPSMEKTFFVFSSITIIEFEISITFEKHISQFKKLLPTSLIASEIILFILIIWSHIKKLPFIKIPINISLIINLYGLLFSTIPKLESKCLTPKYNTNPIKSAFAISKNPGARRCTKYFF